MPTNSKLPSSYTHTHTQYNPKQDKSAQPQSTQTAVQTAKVSSCRLTSSRVSSSLHDDGVFEGKTEWKIKRDAGRSRMKQTISERKWYEERMRKCVSVCYVIPRWGLLSWIEVSPGGWLLQLSRSLHTSLHLFFFFTNTQPGGVRKKRKRETNNREQWMKCERGKGDDVIEGPKINRRRCSISTYSSDTVHNLRRKHFTSCSCLFCVCVECYYLSSLMCLMKSLRTSSRQAQSWDTNMSRYWTSAYCTPTTHTNTATWGTAADNSLYSGCLRAETAEVALWSLSDCWLKMGFTVPDLDLYYCCGNPSSDPRSALKTDFTPLSCCKNRKQRVGAQIWANTAL